MPLCIEELDARGVHVPVLIGGAAINRAFGRRSEVLPDGRVYEPAVFYCKDVFEGLATMDALTDPARRDALVEQVRAEAQAVPQPVTSLRAALDGCPTSARARATAAVLGRAQRRRRPARRLAPPRPQHAVPPPLGRPPGRGRRVRAHHSRGLRAHSRRADGGCAARWLARAAHRVGLLPVQRRRRRAVDFRRPGRATRGRPTELSRASPTANGCVWPTISDRSTRRTRRRRPSRR